MTEQHGNRSVPPDRDRGPVQPGQLFALLADSRCRHLLYHLREASPCRLPAVARDIASRESGAIGSVSPASVRAVYLDLHRTHLPKLDAAGVVDYSERLGEVALVPTDEAFTQCLDAAASMEQA